MYILAERIFYFMNKFISVIERPSRVIALIATALAGICAMLGTFEMYQGNFLSVLIAILDTVLVIGVFVIGFLLLLLKKQAILCTYSMAILAGGLVYAFNRLFSIANAYGGLDYGLAVAAGFFLFAEIAAFIVAFVFFGLAIWKWQTKFYPLAKLLAVIAFIPGFIALIMLFVIFGQMEATWTSYPQAIAVILAIPCAVLFTLFYAQSANEAPVVDAPNEEAPIAEEAESVEEAPVEEQPAENPEEK